MSAPSALPPAMPAPPRRRRWVRRLQRALRLYLFLLLISWGLMLAGLANVVVLFPTRQPIFVPGTTQRAIAFGSGHLYLSIARSPGCAHREPVAFDLELAGNGSRAEGVAMPVALRWGQRPVEVWALNYSGFGQSTGPATLKSIPPAALAAYDAVAAVANGRSILLGSHSLGTAAALYVATQRKVAGIVLLNPPPLRQLILRHYGWWNLWLGAVPVASQIPTQLDSLANGATLHVPAVFLSGTRDTIVPPRFHRMVYDAYAGPKRLILLPGSGHNDFPDPATLSDYKAALDWLWPPSAPDSPPINSAMPPPSAQIK